MPNRQGTAEGGIRPDMRITKRNSLPCAVTHNITKSLWVCMSPAPLFHCGTQQTLKVIVHKEEKGFKGNTQRQSFVPWSTAQQ